MFLNSRLIILFTVFLVYPSISAAHHNEQYKGGATYSTPQSNCFTMSSIDETTHPQLSREERQWYATFQHGSLLFDGWQDICKSILAEIPPRKEEQTAALLGNIGKRIGTEWAKNNAVRKIDTDQLRIWGDKLKEARDEGNNEIYETVEKIADEVDDILNK